MWDKKWHLECIEKQHKYYADSVWEVGLFEGMVQWWGFLIILAL